MKKNYKMKKTISMKMFIAEFGESFSDHMKNKLMELDMRSVLTRKEESNILDLKHVEHTKHECTSESEGTFQKEYNFGQFLIIDGSLYFSESSIENEKVVQSPIVNQIYNNLTSETAVTETEITGKKIDDSNIDYIIDTLLTVFPEVSKEYLSIMSKYYK